MTFVLGSGKHAHILARIFTYVIAQVVEFVTNLPCSGPRHPYERYAKSHSGSVVVVGMQLNRDFCVNVTWWEKEEAQESYQHARV
jgi:hypothetical protein